MSLELIVLLAVLIALSAFFSGSELALVSVQRLRVRMLVKEKARGAKSLQKLKKNLHKAIITILIGNNLVNIFASSLATALAIEVFGSLGVGIAVGVMLFLILVFGEIVPKTFCTTNAERVALFSAPILEFLMMLFSPVIPFFEIIPEKLFRLSKKQKHKPIVTETEIKEAVEVGVEEKAIEKQEKVMINRVLLFNDITVDKVMISREKMIGINHKSSVEEALRVAAKKGFSRYPVFSDGKVLGTVHVKNMMVLSPSKRKRTNVKNVMIPPVFVDYNTIIDDVFNIMKRKRIHIAYVEDSHKIIGLVTLEDLIEELLGEIRDEQERIKGLRNGK